MFNVFKRAWNSQWITDSLAIRNTNAATSATVNLEGTIDKSLYVKNGLDQNASIQIQGCWRNSEVDADWVNIGTGQAVNAGVKSIIGVNEVAQLKNYFAWIRITITCAVAPTTGGITVVLMSA